MPDLNPQQFVEQHADFHKWAKSEARRVSDEAEFTPGVGTRYTPEQGRKMSQLHGATRWLTDNYSDVAHGSFGRQRPHEEIVRQLGIPLHSALPDHLHPVVDEYLQQRQ